MKQLRSAKPRQQRRSAGEIPHHHRRQMSLATSEARVAAKAKAGEVAVPAEVVVVVVVAVVAAEVVAVVVAEEVAAVSAMQCVRILLIHDSLTTGKQRPQQRVQQQIHTGHKSMQKQRKLLSKSQPEWKRAKSTKIQARAIGVLVQAPAPAAAPAPHPAAHRASLALLPRPRKTLDSLVSEVGHCVPPSRRCLPRCARLPRLLLLLLERPAPTATQVAASPHLHVPHKSFAVCRGF